MPRLRFGADRLAATVDTMTSRPPAADDDVAGAVTGRPPPRPATQRARHVAAPRRPFQQSAAILDSDPTSMSTWASPSSSPEIVTGHRQRLRLVHIERARHRQRVVRQRHLGRVQHRERRRFSCSATTVNRPSAIDSATAWFSI